MFELISFVPSDLWQHAAQSKHMPSRLSTDRQVTAGSLLSVVVTSVFTCPDHVKAQIPFPLDCGKMQLHQPLAKC